MYENNCHTRALAVGEGKLLRSNGHLLRFSVMVFPAWGGKKGGTFNPLSGATLYTVHCTTTNILCNVT
jgi:hypothetical protein